MKKNMLRNRNSIRIGGLLLLLALVSCNKLEVESENFDFENLTEYYGDSHLIDIRQVPEQTMQKLVNDMNPESKDLSFDHFGNGFFYSWYPDNKFKKFAIYTSDGCVDRFIYFVYEGSKYISSKEMAGFEDCAGSYLLTNCVIGSDKIEIVSSGREFEEVYGSETIENCLVKSDGTIACDEPFSIHPGLSLWNGLALRQTPEKDGKFISLVNMGETFKTADSVKVTDEDEYVYVELKGGQQGYILNRLVQQKAVPYAIKYNADIYSRPDKLTRSDKSFKRMDLVAIMEIEGGEGWLKVKGRSPGDKWFKEGWITSDRGTQNPIEVAVSSMVNRALEEKDNAKRNAAIKDIYTNPNFEGSELRIYAGNYLPELNHINWEEE